MDNIICNYTNWKVCENNTDKRKNNKYFLNNEEDLCPFLNLQLSTRIGSDSQYGEVYRFSPPNHKSSLFALKIIPFQAENKDDILQEVKINKKLSDYCLKTGYQHYPIFYGFGDCNSIVLHPKSKLPNINGKTAGFFALYEMLSFDFIQFMNFIYNKQLKVSSIECISYLIKVIDIIENFNYVQGLYHNDLHLGNLMFRCYECEKSDIVLIDFGKSSPECKMPGGDIASFIYFLDSFIQGEFPYHLQQRDISVIERFNELGLRPFVNCVEMCFNFVEPFISKEKIIPKEKVLELKQLIKDQNY